MDEYCMPTGRRGKGTLRSTMTNPSTPPLLLHSIDEAAATLSVHRRTIERFIRRGQLRAVRLGTRIAIDDADLRAFVEARKTDARPSPKQTPSNPTPHHGQ
jgi:excisionase family DNA binding protein